MATLRIHGSKPHTYKKFPLQKKYPALQGGDFLFLGNPTTVKIPITKDNFVKIDHKWNKDVCEHINISKETWMDFKNAIS
jgi:hypothetical protein